MINIFKDNKLNKKFNWINQLRWWNNFLPLFLQEKHPFNSSYLLHNDTSYMINPQIIDIHVECGGLQQIHPYVQHID